MINGRICSESCFQYDPNARGCSYTQTDFRGVESIEPGQPCLHPEFDESKLVKCTLMDFCNALAE